MDLGLTGRVYIVTGASSGLGFATAAALNADGAKVVLASRDATRVGNAVERLAHPQDAAAIAADLADEGTASRLVEEAHSRFGRLDGAVISVGGPAAGTSDSVTDQQWRNAFDSIILGTLRLARSVLQQGGSDDAGAAVTIVASTSVKQPIGGLAISNGLRPGLAMAAKTLADEYGPQGARVNVVMPGSIATYRLEQLEAATDDPAAARAAREASIPMGRVGEPQEFGRVAAFLTSPAASYVSGVALAVDGGATRAL